MERVHPIKDTVIKTDSDLAATLASGQTFAFAAGERGYSGIVDGRPVRIRVPPRRADSTRRVDSTRRADGAADGGCGVPAAYEIECAGVDAEFWTRYFDLGRSYGGELAAFITEGGEFSARVPVSDGSGYRRGLRYLAACVAAFGGLRLLRQPVWETLCAFILSANNHQKRIESLYRRLSERYGDAVRWDGGVFYTFPAPERLAAATEGEFRELGLGYRAPYMLETARLVAAEGLPDPDATTYEDALKCLMRMKGVGEKVADCVLLFSTRHRVAFPVDVWIERALRDIFGMSGTRGGLKREAQALFGDAAGLAQQFIFHGIRSNLRADGE